MKTAEAIATRIQNDILGGHFDITLDSYRVVHKTPHKITHKALITLWDAWAVHLDLPVTTREHHYKAIRQQILKVNPDVTDTLWLTQSTLGASTFNQRLGYLKACFKWAMSAQLVLSNPYDIIKNRKVVSNDIKPFTGAEITKILQGFDLLFPHYSPFVRFLMVTGVRTSEAIGLRWQHIDLDKGEVVIQESLSRDWAGNGYQRVRKETKTGITKHLYLPPGLLEVLKSIKTGVMTPDALVFTTPNHKPIDDGNFRERYWVKVLAHIGVPYRNPYTMRHTMASHAIDQGTPLTGVAYLLGHKDTTMVMKTYGHMINRPRLPDIPLD
ncbi:site-specific integrase [Fortiea contorta]|uniref:site-specific integrase n=1 Tax=Fortiea contorta TaxID=1892405 RepID=UPI001EE68FC4|nr:site-specific integrase [Fortiea contorta]